MHEGKRRGGGKPGGSTQHNPLALVFCIQKSTINQLRCQVLKLLYPATSLSWVRQTHAQKLTRTLLQDAFYVSYSTKKKKMSRKK
jgi:hypothetical protein